MSITSTEGADMVQLNFLVSLVNAVVNGQLDGGAGLLPMLLVVLIGYKPIKAEVKICIHWK